MDIWNNFCQPIAVPEAPTSVKALVMSADSILVSWLPPERPNGIITQYTVYYKEHGKSDTEVSAELHIYYAEVHCAFHSLCSQTKENCKYIVQ